MKIPKTIGSPKTVLRLLAQAPKNEWHVTLSGYIRDKYARCPLCYLADTIANRRMGFTVAGYAAMGDAGVKLKDGVFGAIASAADFSLDPLRYDLMKALDMTQ